jgi:hypothetical protein
MLVIMVNFGEEIALVTSNLPPNPVSNIQ